MPLAVIEEEKKETQAMNKVREIIETNNRKFAMW
jgi:hypothetical protein